MLAILVSGRRFSALTGRSADTVDEADEGHEASNVIVPGVSPAAEPRCRLAREDTLEGMSECLPLLGRLSRRAVVARGAKDKLLQTPNGTE